MAMLAFYHTRPVYFILKHIGAFFFMETYTKINVDTDPFWSVLEESDRTSMSLACKSTLKIMSQCRILDRFIDFSSTEVIKKYIACEFRNNVDISCASKIIDRVNGKNRTVEGPGKYGRVFPVDSEVMAYAMENASNKKVLEIAGASGENSIMMAFAGAERVYYNDITHEEVAIFKQLHSSLPSKVQQKLEIIDGSCFDILKKKPGISNKIDLVICRNLIHFFNASELEKFFDTIKKALKVGGKVILTANSKKNLIEGVDFHENSPANFSFKLTQCMVTDGIAPLAILHRSLHACPHDRVSTDFKEGYLFLRNPKTEGKWVQLPFGNANLEEIELPVRKKVDGLLGTHQKEIFSLPCGSIKFVTQTLCAFNKYSLQKLFQTHGFKVESTFITSPEGHLAKCSEDAVQIGIIATKK